MDKAGKTLKYILDRHNLDINAKMPLVLHGGRRGQLPIIFREAGFKVGAEIGVQTGHYSETLCRRIPGLKLYSIDPWASYGWYAEKSASQAKMNGWYQIALKRLKQYNCEIIRGYSENVVYRFEDNSLDFVFIDGNHDYEHVLQDIDLWIKKIKVGGIMSGHDFFNDKEDPTRCSVKKAVLKWIESNRVKTWFLLKGDKHPSWLWVKE